MPRCFFGSSVSRGTIGDTSTIGGNGSMLLTSDHDHLGTSPDADFRENRGVVFFGVLRLDCLNSRSEELRRLSGHLLNQ